MTFIGGHWAYIGYKLFSRSTMSECNLVWQVGDVGIAYSRWWRRYDILADEWGVPTHSGEDRNGEPTSALTLVIF